MMTTTMVTNLHPPSRKAVAPPKKKKKKELTPEERAVESAKRKDRRHTQDAKGEAAAATAIAAAAQHEDINARVKAATTEALLYLGVNPSQHGLVNTAVAAAAASMGSSAYPRMMLPESSRVSCMQLIPGFHAYLQGNRFSGKCSLEVSIVAPSTPAPVTIDLNAAPVAGGSSSGGMRKRQREMPADMLTSVCNLFDRISATIDDDTANRFLNNMIFKGATNDPHDSFMQDHVGLDGLLLDHEFSEDYDVEEEEDDMDIDGKPLFKDELANQTAAGAKPERKGKRTKTYTLAEDKLICECWRDIGKDPKVFQALEEFKVQHDDKAFHLAHCWTIINGEENFKAQYAALFACGGKEVVQDHGGEKARPRGKTNSKKEDRRDTASIALLEKVEGMINKKDLREEKRRQEKEEEVHAFMGVQRRRLEMNAERQAKMLELEEAKQAKMVEIEATNAKSKAKEVALANMKTPRRS
ncbi:Phospholipid-transporting ATPase 1 [Hordeum vulgare]|nr:Phospholipid-transporting ATPase 1 [Hordeum vulgare]